MIAQLENEVKATLINGSYHVEHHHCLVKLHGHARNFNIHFLGDQLVGI